VIGPRRRQRVECAVVRLGSGHRGVALGFIEVVVDAEFGAYFAIGMDAVWLYDGMFESRAGSEVCDTSREWASIYKGR
jgi:hypothetical protein